MVKLMKLPNGNVKIHIDCVLKSGANYRHFQLPVADNPVDRHDYPPIVQLVAKARRWKELLVSGTYRRMEDLAAALGICEAYLRDVLRLAYLSPIIIDLIVKGELPEASVTKYGTIDTPFWYEQEELIAKMK